MITNHFGYWTNFHDANLLSFEPHESESGKQTLDLVLHAFSMTNTTDARGYFVLEKHCQVHFCFGEIESLNLEGFVRGNIILDLSITRDDDKRDWAVHADVVINPPHLSFRCTQPEVVSLTPCDAEGRIR